MSFNSSKCYPPTVPRALQDVMQHLAVCKSVRRVLAALVKLSISERDFCIFKQVTTSCFENL